MSVEIRIPGAPPLHAGACRVIAEAGANHNNSVARAIEMARLAAAAGAWAVKYQLYKADRISVPDSPKYWTDAIGTVTQHDAFRLSDHLDYDDYGAVAEACERLGIIFFATPFDTDAVEALDRIGAPLYKVASGDLTHRPLLEAIAATGKPAMLSTGAATDDEIERAIGWTGYGPDRLVLLVCTLTYPTPDVDGNFARIEAFRRRFDPYLVGMSDHTLGTAGGWLTAALGGVCIEKHYTIDKSLPDVPDHAMSVDPDELAELVADCNRAAVLRGSEWIGVRPSEQPARAYARRSIVLEQDVPQGDVLTREALGFKRPGTGLSPDQIDAVVGRRARRQLARNELVRLEDLE